MPDLPTKPQGSPPNPVWPFSVEEAFKAADAELELTPHRQFSREAFSELNSSIRAYIADLIAASARMARRQDVDSISAAHVRHAVRTITPVPSKRLSRVSGIAGGMLMGAFIPEFIKAVSDKTPLSLAWVVAGLFGFGLLVYEQAKD